MKKMKRGIRLSEIKFVPMQVEYVDHMGSDVNVVNAARVSFAKKVDEFESRPNTKSKRPARGTRPTPVRFDTHH